jgi:hypothetical protein
MTHDSSYAHQVLRFLLIVVAAGLVLAGCDSGPATDTADGVIAPVTPQIDFRVQPDLSQSDTLTLDTPADGSSSFLVTFTGPRQSGNYASPIRFRAGGVTATVRFAGTVIGPQTIADFESGTEGFFAFGGPGISQEEGQLRIDGTNLGGVGVFPGISKPFSAPTNFEDTPVVEMRIRATASSDGPAVIRTALNGAGDNADANVTVPELVAEVPADGEYATYYFDFRGNFQQFDGVPVDPTQMGEIVLLLKPEHLHGNDLHRRNPPAPRDPGV